MEDTSRKITFPQIIRYAEAKGYEHRGEPSRAKDYTQYYFTQYGQIYMALYEGPRRILRGHDKPEVCWWCIDHNGKIVSLPSRSIRTSDYISGFGLTDKAKEEIFTFLGINRKSKELSQLI